MNKQKFHCLVADTTTFINNVAVQELAEYVITVKEVLKEIKNKRQLKRVCVLPYDLVVDEPSPESVRHVIEFAKKTGDYLSLSAADIKVIALTYQLEKQLVGEAHLRIDPVIARTIASPHKPAELLDRVPLAGFYRPPNREELTTKSELNKDNPDLNKERDEDAKNSKTDSSTDESSDDDDDDADNVSITEEELAKNIANVNLNETNEIVDQMLVSVAETEKIEEVDEASSEEEHDEETDDDDDDDDNDDDSWITPSNIKAVKSAYGKDAAEEQEVRVACMTTDYAIQNVLKQINLNIAALDGKVIKNMRTYILRCYSCFKTTSLMTKIFCPNCGHNTLKRVAVSLDENGQQIIHINTRRPLTAKGKNTSIPRPRGGKHSSNPILFEDQPIPKQMPSRVARTKTDALDEDYIAGYSPFVLRDIDSKSALLRAKGGATLKQWARNHDYLNLKRRSKK